MNRRRRYSLLQKVQDLKTEEVEEEDKVHISTKIIPPIVWLRTADGVRIQDLRKPYYDVVLKMFMEYYLNYEILSNNSGMKDDIESEESFLNRMLYYLKDSVSIVAVHEYNKPKKANLTENWDESENEEEMKKSAGGGDVDKASDKKSGEEETFALQEVVGCLVMKIVNKANFAKVFSRVQLVEGDAYKKCVAIRNHLTRKVDIFAQFNCDAFLRIYGLCIKPKYRNRELGTCILRCGFDVARGLKIPVVMGIFSDCKLQKIAKSLGLQVIQELSYANWKDPEGAVIFGNPGIGNNTIAVMAGEVPPPPKKGPPPDMVFEREKSGKKKRQDGSRTKNKK